MDDPVPFLEDPAAFVVPLLAGGAAMFWTPYKRLPPALRTLGAGERVAAVLWVPVIRIIGDIAKMLGYPVGVGWRLTHRKQIPRWRH